MQVLYLGITAIIGWLMLFLSYSYNASYCYWTDKAAAAVMFMIVSVVWVFGSGLFIAQAVLFNVN